MFEAGGPEDAEVTTFFDDAGRKTIARQRAGAMVRFNSLFGNRDPLALGMMGANGTLGAFANYSVPLGTRGLRLGGSFDYNTIEINAGPLASAGLVGHSFDASARLSRPLLVRSNVIFNAWWQNVPRHSRRGARI
jgi:hemolysin activation/secretion protein